MNRNLKRKSESALDELMHAFEAARDEILGRMSKIDADELADRALKMSQAARKRIDADEIRGRAVKMSGRALKASRTARRRAESRIRPRRSRPSIPLIALALGIGAAAGYVLIDAGRRQRMRTGVTRLTETARDRIEGMGVSDAVDGVMNRVRPNNSAAVQDGALREEVESALGGAGLPAGVDLSVEGRTVYLRGTVSDSDQLDHSMEKIQSLTGVVAVVNLTVPAARAGSANSH